MLTRVPSDLTDVARRRVLLGAAAAPLMLVATGCTDEPAPQVVVDPDREALEAAYGVEDQLGRLLTQWTSSPDEARTRADAVIGQHLDALSASLGGVLGGEPLPTASPPESDPAASPDASTATTTDLVRALDDAADAHSRALRTASAPISPLLASIAASDAALAASLRGGR